jgi:L-fuconolactonase
MAQTLTRIDAHQHFWEFRQTEYPWIGEDMRVLRQDWQPQALLPELHRQRLDACIAVQARTRAIETDYLLSLASQHDWIAGVVGWIDLRADDLARHLERWHEHKKLRGFRHPLQDEPEAAAFMNDVRFRQGVERLQAQGYVYDVLVLSHQLDAAVAFCAALDTHWLVLDHLGKPAIRAGAHDHVEWRRRIEPLRGMPHVVCKVSGLVTEADRGAGVFDESEIRRHLDMALEIFGAERLMYGSDWPVCLLSASYSRVCQIVRDWCQALSPGEQDALWGGTAARTYGLHREISATYTLGVASWI